MDPVCWQEEAQSCSIGPFIGGLSPVLKSIEEPHGLGFPSQWALNGQVTEANDANQVTRPIIFSLHRDCYSSLPPWRTALPSIE